jgi:hypothetical protein
LYRQQCRTPLF